MILTELATYLATLTGRVVGTNLFKGDMPDTPDNCMCLYEYGGAEPEQALNGVVAGEHPNVQVVVRGAVDDYSTPRDALQTTWAALAVLGNTTLTGVRYHTVTPLQSPFWMKRDPNGRHYLACNFAVLKDAS